MQNFLSVHANFAVWLNSFWFVRQSNASTIFFMLLWRILSWRHYFLLWINRKDKKRYKREMDQPIKPWHPSCSPVPSAAGPCGPPSGSHQVKWLQCRGRGRRGQAWGCTAEEWAAWTQTGRSGCKRPARSDASPSHWQYCLTQRPRKTL